MTPLAINKWSPRAGDIGTILFQEHCGEKAIVVKRVDREDVFDYPILEEDFDEHDNVLIWLRKLDGTPFKNVTRNDSNAVHRDNCKEVVFNEAWFQIDHVQEWDPENNGD
jgi:hypothetical protein